MQKYSSKLTSINSNKLPAIYNKLNHKKMKNGTLFDYGCGKYINHIQNKLIENNINYVGYDKYWNPNNIHKLHSGNIDFIVCLNVLNVIKENEEVKNIHDDIRKGNIPYFITIYEGDKSGIGKANEKRNSYQRNEKINNYKYDDEIIYKNVITKPEWKSFIK